MPSTLHHCSPPADVLSTWLACTLKAANNYGHLLLEETGSLSQAQIVAALRPYFESAHLDARTAFHEFAEIDLHPFATSPGAHAQYPGCLPSTARRGLFGEVMIGLVAEAHSLGGHTWRVPVYLFRYHEEAKYYIFDLARDPGRVRAIGGRQGNDFIAIALSPDGAVARLLAGEAKWREALTQSTVHELMHGKWRADATDSSVRVRDGKGIYAELNRDHAAPKGLAQLRQLLYELAPDTYGPAILSMAQCLTLRVPTPLPRTDLVFIIGERSATRAKGAAFLPTDQRPSAYTAPRDLHAVEVVLENGTGADLIEQLYAALYLETIDVAA